MDPLVDFFIVGAPKCGTTSLSSWLTQHERIYVCKPKEPYYFSTDIRSSKIAETQDEYQGLFTGVQDKHIVVGEASTTYLRSGVAASKILKYNPKAKFIVCLRNPVEMVASVHMQLYKSGEENQRNLQDAWLLQDERLKGLRLPPFCREPRNLQYGKNCSLGTQMRNLLTVLPRSQLHWMLLDDMRDNPNLVYEEVLAFLGVPSDGLANFQPENTRKEPRSAMLAVVIRLLSECKKYLGIKSPTGLGAVVQKINMKEGSMEETLSDDFRILLEEFFRGEINTMSELLDRDLSHWLR